MLWILIRYPRAAVVIVATLFAFAAAVAEVGRHPLLAGAACAGIAVGGIAAAVRVARWEARLRGGTGSEGSGLIEPGGPGTGW